MQKLELFLNIIDEKISININRRGNYRMKAYKVFADGGHGGDDNGAAWGEKYDYLEEDDLNLIISFLLRYELQLAGFEVKLSRERDVFVSLEERVRMANSWGADVFISIHADAFHKTTVKGITTHIYTRGSNDSLILATWIQTELTKRFIDHTNRGTKKSNFYVLRESYMPAVLVECDFISNPKIRRFLKEPENQLALAKAIGTGIRKNFKARIK
jgi:N-acetylmuramoyl-L-alanine amidase